MKPLIAALVLAACTPLPPLPPVVNVIYDGGGLPMPRAATIKQMTRVGTTVRIEGRCNSACTMYLAVPNVCVAPDAVLGFHSAWSVHATDRMYIGVINQFVSRHYPDNLKSLFLSDYSKSVEFTYLTGQQVHDLDGVRLCD